MEAFLPPCKIRVGTLQRVIKIHNLASIFDRNGPMRRCRSDFESNLCPPEMFSPLTFENHSLTGIHKPDFF